MSTKAIEHFTAIADRDKAVIQKFAAEVIADPVRALSWSYSAFQAGARLHVAEMVLYRLAPPSGRPACSIADIQEDLLAKVTNRAASPTNSTLPTANITETCLLAAYADAYREIGYFLSKD